MQTQQICGMGELKHILRKTDLEIKKMYQRYWRGGFQIKKVNYQVKIKQGLLEKCAVGS